MIHNCQYLSTDYPLKQFRISEIPLNICETIEKLSCEAEALVRGGLCYVLYTHDDNYVLKDLDMIAKQTLQDKLINILQATAAEIYINHNHFNNPVITAFWPCQKLFYKLDILLCCNMPEKAIILWNNQEISSVLIEYIWLDRISKISEREIRNHSIQKTLSHYNVAMRIANYINAFSSECPIGDAQLTLLITKAHNSLLPIIGAANAAIFLEKQTSVARKWSK